MSKQYVQSEAQSVANVNAFPSSSSVNTEEKTRMSSLTILVIVSCWFAILADGYDLGIYGAVLPKLLEYQAWGLTPASAGVIASYALFGMLIGAILVGTITDLIGRKWTLIACLVLFSITMALSAMATTPEMFGFVRFIGGIGLGGVIPTASALTIEYSPVKRRSLAYAIMFTGYSFGIVLGALLSILLLEEYGWRFMFWIGAVPLLIVPFLIRYIPESLSFLVMKGRRREAEEICKRYDLDMPEQEHKEEHGSQGRWQGISTLFSKPYIKATLLFWVVDIMAMFLIYGLNTWLPQMMRKAGYPLGSSLSFLLMLNLTAVVGVLIAGAIADRWGSKRVISISYFLAAAAIAFLSIKSSLLVVYILVGIAGFGSVGITQILNAYVTKYYPPHARATALGWMLGFGRIGAISGPILIGVFMSMQFDMVWNFYIFAIAGLLACIAVLLIPVKDDDRVI
ncbi:aromatic acid/H+ symport family MFS transporter [Aneurinibacillus sp. BA2021]|nr:aromatic acid/H+ symport family MFS transporter [Aneurinibacillus sp. BA2021]